MFEPHVLPQQGAGHRVLEAESGVHLGDLSDAEGLPCELLCRRGDCDHYFIYLFRGYGAPVCKGQRAFDGCMAGSATGIGFERVIGKELAAEALRENVETVGAAVQGEVSVPACERVSGSGEAVSRQGRGEDASLRYKALGELEGMGVVKGILMTWTGVPSPSGNVPEGSNS